MTLAQLRRRARTIEVPWQVDDSTVLAINVTYDPGKITMKSQDIPNDGKTLHDFWEEKLQEYVNAWDLMGDDGMPIPIDADGIAQLETAMVQTILTAIQDDARPKPKTTTNT